MQSEGFTIEEIGKHNKEDDMWTHYKGNVYDLTKFVKNHPGGNVILRAAGKDLEKVWQEYNVGWHEMNENVMKLLESYKIGKVKNNKTTKISWHSNTCLLYTSPSPRDGLLSRMPSSA